MKRIVTLIILILISFELVKAQKDIREQVYVHLNSQVLIPGETLYFSAYCNSQMTGQPSGMSKILYVEIVGENGPVHQQKVSLQQGRGHSDFFVNSLIPSGQYHLIAYTRWMKNFGDYYHCPVTIINPYESYPNDRKETATDLVFYPQSDPLTGGIENLVAYHLQTNDPSTYKIRVVNSAGEMMSEINPDQFGLGLLKFTPKKGKTYQVLLENPKGEISFYDLPEVAGEGSSIVYKKVKGWMSLKCEIAGQTYDSLSLSLFSEAGEVYQSRVDPNAYHAIPQNVFSSGGGHVKYTSPDGATVAERFIAIIHNDPKRIDLNKTYDTRQKVSIKTGLDEGEYSISVRKKTGNKFNHHHHAAWSRGLNHLMKSPVSQPEYLSSSGGDMEALVLASKKRGVSPIPDQVSLLPEIREEILTGKVTDSAGNPAAGQKISLTFPGDPFQLRIGESDERGVFIIPFQSPVSDTEAIVTNLNLKSPHKIKVDNPFLDKYPDFNFQLPSLDSSLVREIIDKSIRVQIENAYFDLSQKTSISNQWKDGLPFHTTYLLDDYKRFSTLKETFTEYIITANVRENRDYVIKTNYSPGLFKETYPPLVLLDGVPVSGENAIQVNPYEVKSISILPNRYFLGPMVIDGIVGIKTFDDDYQGFQVDFKGNQQKKIIKKVSSNMRYSFPDYSESNRDHEADQRDQLFWDPEFITEAKNSEISFYTSDVPGTYEMIIEGFTEKGKPVSKIFTFEVK